MRSCKQGHVIITLCIHVHTNYTTINSKIQGTHIAINGYI